MVQSNRGKLLTTFRYPVRVEVRKPKLERSASLAYVDAAKLAQAARAEFEVGYIEAGCCRKAVLAVVRRGMVTGIRVEACAECKPVRLTPELATMLNVARRRIGRRARPFRPMPVAQFISGVAEIIVENGYTYCEEYCITIGGYGICIVCCEVILGGRRCWFRIAIPSTAAGAG